MDMTLIRCSLGDFWRFWIGWGKTFPAETKQPVFFGKFLVEKFGEIVWIQRSFSVGIWSKRYM